MRWTQTLIPTLRNLPKDAEAVSHKLALRAGLVRQLSSGVYSYLPLGFRVLQKIENIVREEMNAAGAVEVLLPALHPAELWKKSGRYETLGDDKISFKNRSGQEFVLGPTHEEVITELAGAYLKSFRDMPVTLFQIQTKFRDEARPRFGVIRTKEFIMKDAYSFDHAEEGLDLNYEKMSEAYKRIFTRCGLDYQVVTADSGLMGGKMSQEFMVVCPYGEDKVAKAENSEYLASIEIAFRANPKLSAQSAALEKPEPFETPNLRTIDEISKKYKIKSCDLVKCILYVADENPVAALVRGDTDINESKLRKLVGCKTLRLATSAEIKEVTGAPVGFSGPVGLKVPLYADWDLEGMGDFVCGGNQKDTHLKGVLLGRDFKPQAIGDLRYVKEGDLAPDGGGKLLIKTTMEIGHIFKLGTRYSACLDAKFADEKGNLKPILMGCYGIGVTRVLAAVIEEHHDDKGIKWPHEVAPFDFEIITVNHGDEGSRDVADKIYNELLEQGYDVLYDDRDERAGVKFKDADLIGMPVQIIIGERNLKEGKLELKFRETGESKLVPVDSAEVHL